MAPYKLTLPQNEAPFVNLSSNDTATDNKRRATLNGKASLLDLGVVDEKALDVSTDPIAHRSTQHIALPPESTIIFRQVIDHLNQGAIDTATLLLATNVHLLMDTLPSAQLDPLFAAIQAKTAQNDPDCTYIQASAMIRAGDFEHGIAALQRAQMLYWNADRQAEAIRCTVEIARAYSNQENFQMARHYLNEKAKPLLEQCEHVTANLRADYLLQMANIAVDTGHLHTSTDYAQQALTYHISTGNIDGQFRAQLRIARNFMQCGNYTEAHSRLQLIRQYFHIGKLGAAAEGLLLNAEIHLRWYMHQFEAALRLNQLYLKLAKHKQLPYAQLYAHILFANIYRDQGDYQHASKWYDETEECIKQHGYHFYQPWVDAQRSWLLLLQGNLERANYYCSRAQQTTDWGQRMSFQVEKAVIHLLQGRIGSAEKLLEQSLNYYEDSGDPLASSAIRIYLAYAALQQEDTGKLLHYLNKGLGGMAQLQLDVLPYWWHPQLVAEVCCHAIVADIHTVTVKDIITKRLGRDSSSALTKLLNADDLDVREQAHQLLSNVSGETSMILAHLENSPAKQVLQEHIDNGWVRADHYARMEAELVTAKTRRSPNTTLLAVFVLHMHGVKRRAIAERLGCSMENVRNYITRIYQHFNLLANDFNSRTERRQRLVTVAREYRFIP